MSRFGMGGDGRLERERGWEGVWRGLRRGLGWGSGDVLVGQVDGYLHDIAEGELIHIGMIEEVSQVGNITEDTIEDMIESPMDVCVIIASADTSMIWS